MNSKPYNTRKAPTSQKIFSEGNDLCQFRVTNILRLRIVLRGALSFILRSKWIKWQFKKKSNNNNNNNYYYYI